MSACSLVLLATKEKLSFDLSFILQWLVWVCGRSCTRVSKHRSDSQLIFFLRTRRTIRSSNLIISGGLVRAQSAASAVLDAAVAAALRHRDAWEQAVAVESRGRWKILRLHLFCIKIHVKNVNRASTHKKSCLDCLA